MLLGFENALAAYSPFEVRRIQDLVGQYTIQSVAEISQGVDIGVTDASTSNMSAIRSAIERMGISPDAVSFHHESAIRDNPWYIDYAQDKGGSGDESLPLYLLGGLAALSAAGRSRRAQKAIGPRNRQALQFPHSTLISLNIFSTSSIERPLFSSPERSSTMPPWCIISIRPPYSSA